MRIVLDRQEIASIITNWGKQQYKTQNVSVERINTDGSMDIMVTLQDDNFIEKNKDVLANALAKFRGEPEDTHEGLFNGPPLDTAGNTEFI